MNSSLLFIKSPLGIRRTKGLRGRRTGVAIVAALALQFKGPAVLQGQVFVATNGGNAVKLPLVPVRLYSRDDFSFMASQLDPVRDKTRRSGRGRIARTA